MMRMYTILLLAFASVALGQHTPQVMIAPGPWTMCPMSSQFCTPPGSENWSVWVRSDYGPSVTAYRLVITYSIENGTTETRTIVLDRNDFQTSTYPDGRPLIYTSGWFILGKIHPLTVDLYPLASLKKETIPL